MRTLLAASPAGDSLTEGATPYKLQLRGLVDLASLPSQDGQTQLFTSISYIQNRILDGAGQIERIEVNSALPVFYDLTADDIARLDKEQPDWEHSGVVEIDTSDPDGTDQGFRVFHLVGDTWEEIPLPPGCLAWNYIQRVGPRGAQISTIAGTCVKRDAQGKRVLEDGVLGGANPTTPLLLEYPAKLGFAPVYLDAGDGPHELRIDGYAMALPKQPSPKQ
jgi:hypothetical protein